jgi:hypothetical protein
VAKGILRDIAASVRKVGSRHLVRLQMPPVIVLDPDDTRAFAEQLRGLALDAVRADEERDR